MIIICLLFVVSFCGCESKKYEIRKAYVYKTQTFPLRNSYFKMEIFYKFEYKGDTIYGIYATHRLPVAQKGDSLIVTFPLGKPTKERVVSVVKVIPEFRPYAKSCPKKKNHKP